MKFTPLALSATLVASAFASQQAEPRALGRRGDSDAPQWIKRSVQKMKREWFVLVAREEDWRRVGRIQGPVVFERQDQVADGFFVLPGSTGQGVVPNGARESSLRIWGSWRNDVEGEPELTRSYFAVFLTVAANATATATTALLEAPAEVEIPTYNGTALWYRANNETGACRKVST